MNGYNIRRVQTKGQQGRGLSLANICGHSKYLKGATYYTDIEPTFYEATQKGKSLLIRFT